MPQVKRAAKGKRPNKAISALRNRRGVFGSFDRRIASGYAGGFCSVDRRPGSRYTLAERCAVSGPHSR